LDHGVLWANTVAKDVYLQSKLPKCLITQLDVNFWISLYTEETVEIRHVV
jgi:hypothetical protein